MAKPKWPLTTIVEVLWHDACTRGRWAPKEEYLEQEVLPIATTGYLLKRNKRSIVIIQSQAQNETCSDSITIPLGWIKKITVLRK